MGKTDSKKSKEGKPQMTSLLYPQAQPRPDPQKEGKERPLQKGGVPAAPSGTATLLRLSPNHESHLRRLPPKGWATGFGCYPLS